MGAEKTMTETNVNELNIIEELEAKQAPGDLVYGLPPIELKRH